MLLFIIILIIMIVIFIIMIVIFIIMIFIFIIIIVPWQMLYTECRAWNERVNEKYVRDEMRKISEKYEVENNHNTNNNRYNHTNKKL